VLNLNVPWTALEVMPRSMSTVLIRKASPLDAAGIVAILEVVPLRKV
jgi:hypothetical protein